MNTFSVTIVLYQGSTLNPHLFALLTVNLTRNIRNEDLDICYLHKILF